MKKIVRCDEFTPHKAKIKAIKCRATGRFFESSTDDFFLNKNQDIKDKIKTIKNMRQTFQHPQIVTGTKKKEFFVRWQKPFRVDYAVYNDDINYKQ